MLLRLTWLNLPAAILLSLLQRTPALQSLANSAVNSTFPFAAHVLRCLLPVAALGAPHALAGATTFVLTPPARPISGTVGTPLAVAFTYTGTPSPPQYYMVTGQLPPGLNFIPALTNGIVRSGSPAISGTPTQAGNYTVRVQGFGLAGNGQPEPITFAITGGTAPNAPPSFSLQPVSQTAAAGRGVTFTVTVTGSPTPALQWQRNGNPLPGATNSTLTLTAVQTADAGDYSVVATSSAGSATSSVATLTVLAPTSTSRLSNLSVRTSLDAGGLLTVGVVVSDGPRDILVRAAGPALSAFGLPNPMSDPRLDLYRGQTLVLSNDNWGTGPASLGSTFASVGAFAFANGSRDAALLQSLDADYSIQVRGTGPGFVLVEAYDTGLPSTARLINVSARNQVGTGDNILIAGFAISGASPKPLLIRAVGPRLGAFGVTGFLVDPILEVYSGVGVKLAENDNWPAELAPIFASVGAFALDPGSRDAALQTSLAPGSYTVQVRGAGGGTGEALIEIYEIR